MRSILALTHRVIVSESSEVAFLVRLPQYGGPTGSVEVCVDKRWMIVVVVEGVGFVAATHLSCIPTTRQGQLEELAGVMATSGGKWVVGGDFNFDPASASVKEAGWISRMRELGMEDPVGETTAVSHYANQAQIRCARARRLDWVLSNIKLEGATYMRTPGASDHAIIEAVIQVERNEKGERRAGRRIKIACEREFYPGATELGIDDVRRGDFQMMVPGRALIHADRTKCSGCERGEQQGGGCREAHAVELPRITQRGTRLSGCRAAMDAWSSAHFVIGSDEWCRTMRSAPRSSRTYPQVLSTVVTLPFLSLMSTLPIDIAVSPLR